MGFKILADDKGFSNARGKDVEEFILELTADETTSRVGGGFA